MTMCAATRGEDEGGDICFQCSVSRNGSDAAL